MISHDDNLPGGLP